MLLDIFRLVDLERPPDPSTDGFQRHQTVYWHSDSPYLEIGPFRRTNFLTLPLSSFIYGFPTAQ